MDKDTWENLRGCERKRDAPPVDLEMHTCMHRHADIHEYAMVAVILRCERILACIHRFIDVIMRKDSTYTRARPL